MPTNRALSRRYFASGVHVARTVILPAKATEYVFTGVSLCVFLCVCLWPR